MSLYAAVEGELHADAAHTLARPVQTYCTRGNYDYAIMMTSHCEVLADKILADCSQTANPPKYILHQNFQPLWY